MYSAVVRDILTGYALGFVDSATVDTRTGVAFKDEPSENWWFSPRAFGYLQSNPTYFDQYAAYLQTISGAYGHPFSDRWQTVQVSLDPSTVGTLEIDVLPDAAAMAIASITRTSAGAVHLVGRGAAPGAAVRVESSPDLSAGSWTTLSTGKADAIGTLTFDDNAVAGTKKFYRLVSP